MGVSTKPCSTCSRKIALPRKAAALAMLNQASQMAEESKTVTTGAYWQMYIQNDDAV